MTLGIAGGMLLGFGVGRQWGETELRVLLAMPVGGVHISTRQQAYFKKMGSQTVSWIHVPDPWRAQVAQLFGVAPEAPPPDVTAATTPTTTIQPQEGRK